MAKFATRIYSLSLPSTWDVVALTLNIAILAIVFTTLGSVMSFVFYYLFDEYDIWTERGLEWEKKSVSYQITDLLLEIALISIFSFWAAFFMNERFPIIPVSSRFASYIDTYSTGLFFMYTVFIFVDSFGYKLQHVISKVLAPAFDRFMPDSGSIVDFSLHWGGKKGEKQQQLEGTASDRKNQDSSNPALS